MTDISKSNAEKLGLNTMLFQTQEECAELIVAVSKYNRVNGIGQKTELNKDEAYNNLIEELADVSTCTEQLIYLLNCESDINKIKLEKFNKVRTRLEE